MSEVEGQVTPVGEGVQEQQTVAVEETTVEQKEQSTDYAQLHSTNERLLSESKIWKEKAQALEAEKRNKERAELEQRGEFQTLLEREREEKQSIQRSLEEMKVKTVASNTRAALARVAKDAMDIEDLVRSGNLDLIQMDDDSLMPTEDSVQNFVNDLRNRKPYLFTKRLPKMEDAHPRGEVPAAEKSPRDAFAALLQANRNR